MRAAETSTGIPLMGLTVHAPSSTAGVNLAVRIADYQAKPIAEMAPLMDVLDPLSTCHPEAVHRDRHTPFNLLTLIPAVEPYPDRDRALVPWLSVTS